MLLQQIYPLIAVFLCNAVCFCAEYQIPISSSHSPECKPNHWRHRSANSAIDIKGLEVDVFQWRAAAKNRGFIHLEILNPRWDFAGWREDDIVLPKIIEISDALYFRGTPTVYIRVTPWRIIDGRIEVLSQGEIQISVEPVDFPITYSHPYLLNGDKRSLKRGYSEHTQYLIICPNQFEEAANSLAAMHSDLVDSVYQLNTEVVYTETIETLATELNLSYAIREYMLNRINDDLENDLEFLLLFGDEIYLPPIVYIPPVDLDEYHYPSDDFYTTENMYSGNPQLTSGRIPASTKDEANLVVEKIREYTLTPTPGIWRSKVALVADDLNISSCLPQSSENSHTENSNEIYDALNTLLPVQPFYGVHYGMQSIGSGCAYPDLTRELIRTINNGVALVNYIGHGDPETWAEEKIIDKSRDLPLIQVNKGKLAIWVAGTCAFGKYNRENSFMEALLFKENGAIAVVATTDLISYTNNSTYIKNLFGLLDSDGIQQFLSGNHELRLGQIVKNAKNCGDDEYCKFSKFHTYGDPAMRLPFPQMSIKIAEPPPLIKLIEEQFLSVSNSGMNSTLLIRGNEKDVTFGQGNLVYTMPGAIYAQVNFTGSSGCFRIPLDAGTCDNCSTVIYVYQDNNGSNGRIQFIPNIPITDSNVTFQDNEGPEIEIVQENYPITEGSALLPNTELTISLNDTSGINLMETIGHGIRYAFDEDELILIPGEEFIYNTCSGGEVQIPVSDTPGRHHFYLEVWDGLNNQSTLDINLEILGNPQKDQLLISKVYPFPNPFSESTHFTMFISETPANITITVYSLMGTKVRKLEDKAVESFISIPWDGNDQSGHRIANGAYYYHVQAEKEGKSVFEDIFKLAKIE